jgi:hypothetical protein
MIIDAHTVGELVISSNRIGDAIIGAVQAAESIQVGDHSGFERLHVALLMLTAHNDLLTNILKIIIQENTGTWRAGLREN